MQTTCASVWKWKTVPRKIREGLEGKLSFWLQRDQIWGAKEKVLSFAKKTLTISSIFLQLDRGCFRDRGVWSSCWHQFMSKCMLTSPKADHSFRTPKKTSWTRVYSWIFSGFRQGFCFHWKENNYHILLCLTLKKISFKSIHFYQNSIFIYFTKFKYFKSYQEKSHQFNFSTSKIQSFLLFPVSLT